MVTDVHLRWSRQEDDAALLSIDAATWTTTNSPAPLPPPDRSFFADGKSDVLVAELHGAVNGYVLIGNTIALPSHAHVLEVRGLAVAPAAARRGVGRALVLEAVAEARRRGARKMTLRVLGHNVTARRLYERCGFAVEGVLREEFFLDGRYVDDVLMAVRLNDSSG